jgi:hypothetical protein
MEVASEGLFHDRVLRRGVSAISDLGLLHVKEMTSDSILEPLSKSQGSSLSS